MAYQGSISETNKWAIMSRGTTAFYAQNFHFQLPFSDGEFELFTISSASQNIVAHFPISGTDINGNPLPNTIAFFGTASHARSSSFATSASWAPAGQGAGFPFIGDAEITGTLFMSSAVSLPLWVGSRFDGFTQIQITNITGSVSASSDIVAEASNGNEYSEYVDMGINSPSYSLVSLVGGPSDGYLYMSSTLGELHVGNASVGPLGNVRLFAGGGNSDNATRLFVSSSGRVGVGTAYTASLNSALNVSGGVFLDTVTRPVSGSITVGITATAGQTRNIDLSRHNYFIYSASGAGTVTWTVSNVASSSLMQSFILQYYNGGSVTNTWFTNTRWPGGTAPVLTTGGVDILVFMTNDNGSNWRGTLFMRDSK
jgi:hypothetical protein